MTKIICLGDSLTNHGFEENGWASLLRITNPNLHLLNYGVNKNTSRDILYKLPTLIPTTEIRSSQYCILFLGTNDCLKLFQENVTEQQYSHNLKQIITYFKKYNSRIKCIIVGPPTNIYSVNESTPLKESYIYKYSRQALNVSWQYNLPFIDLMDNTDGNGILFTDLKDGIHMNDNGNQKIFLKLQHHIK